MSWLSENSEQVVQLVWAHLLLSIPAIVVSTIIAVPIAYFAYKRPIIGGPLLSVATLLYAIPALPLLALIPAFFGLPLRSPLTVVIALILYGIALLVRTAADAFAAIDPHLRDAAIAMGFSNRSLFWRVELPASIPVLLSGVRVVTVSTIGLATIGALVGVSNIGTLLTDGFQRGITAEVTVGIVATVVLALLIDAALILLGRAIAPWAHDEASKANSRLGTVR